MLTFLPELFLKIDKNGLNHTSSFYFGTLSTGKDFKIKVIFAKWSNDADTL